MDRTTNQLDILLDLEARHDDLLRRLDELDREVERVLAEWQPAREPEGGLTSLSPAATNEVRRVA